VGSLGLFLSVLFAAHELTRNSLRTSQRYTLALTDIQCSPPLGRDLGEFLTEVQYLADLPDQLPLLDGNLAAQLASAFGRHPWVECVEHVTVSSPRQVQAQLRYRIPVLAVLLPEASQDVPHIMVEISPRASGNKDSLAPTRVVDAHGILLPVTASPTGLPIFASKTMPRGRSGAPWGDSAVQTIAATAGVLHEHRARFQLESFELEDTGLRISTSCGSSILWGRPPGAELSSEAPAKLKVERLLEFCAGNDGLGEEPFEYDVRPRHHALQRPLSRAHPH
jgi:hypothetical protein